MSGPYNLAMSLKPPKWFSWRIPLGVGVLLMVVGLLIYGGISAVKAQRQRTLDRKRAERYPEIRVEVLNATGVNGLAKRVSWRLRDMGFDVVYYGNAADTLTKTVIIERADSSLSNAKELAWAINCKEITFEPDPDGLLEVTLIVGLDYQKIFKDIDKQKVVF